jgi:HSP20 family protein
MSKAAHAISIERLELERLRDHVGRLFATLEAAVEAEVPPAPGSWCPPFDLCESPSGVVVRVELPGVDPDAIDLRLTHDQLQISGEKRRIPRNGVVSHLCSERTYGHFSRRVGLSWPVDVHGATAELEGGVLTIRLPMRKDRRGEEFKIAVKMIE